MFTTTSVTQRPRDSFMETPYHPAPSPRPMPFVVVALDDRELLARKIGEGRQVPPNTTAVADITLADEAPWPRRRGINPDDSCSCRLEQATGNAAGTSVASGAWRRHPTGSSYEHRLRRSGIALRDLGPADMTNPGSPEAARAYLAEDSILDGPWVCL